MPVLEASNLVVNFHLRKGVLTAVDDISFEINANEALGIVGESGSGKTVTSLAIMRLISAPGRVASGKIYFAGEDLLNMDSEKLTRIRGKEISMIFQEPMTSLNPCLTIADQMVEVYTAHLSIGRKKARKKAVEMLERVQIPSAGAMIDRYPHEFSGGMRQRAMIAMALALNPKLLIADEPTTALDVTVQAQVLELINQMKEEFHTALLYITHDLSVIAQVSQKIAIMYAGEIVETADKYELFASPLHPYTRGLLAAIPRKGYRGYLRTIEGTICDLTNPPPGCKFSPRCQEKTNDCQREKPKLITVKPGHQVACYAVD